MLLERYRKASWCIHFEKNKVFSTRFSPVSSSFSHVDSKPSLVFGLFFHPDHFLIEFTCSLLCLTCSVWPALLHSGSDGLLSLLHLQPSPARPSSDQPSPDRYCTCRFLTLCLSLLLVSVSLLTVILDLRRVFWLLCVWAWGGFVLWFSPYSEFLTEFSDFLSDIKWLSWVTLTFM